MNPYINRWLAPIAFIIWSFQAIRWAWKWAWHMARTGELPQVKKAERADHDERYPSGVEPRYQYPDGVIWPDIPDQRPN